MKCKKVRNEKNKGIIICTWHSYVWRKSRNTFTHMLEVVSEFNKLSGYKVSTQNSMLGYGENNIFYNSIEYRRRNLTKYCKNPTQKAIKHYWKKLRKTKINGGLCMFVNWNTQNCKDANSLQIGIFDSHENPSKFYVETDKLILKIILEVQKPNNSPE